jgi:putative alpha-1,2-mannosidase
LEIYRAVSPHCALFVLHRETPNQSCAIGKNIQAILEQMQIQIDVAIRENSFDTRFLMCLNRSKNVPR